MSPRSSPRGLGPLLLAAALAGCSHAAPPPPVTPPPAEPVVAAPRPPDPPDEPAPRPLLTIDWSKVSLQSDADALELWQRIAPTGADWALRLGELPADDDLQRRLALALLRSGNFACRPQPGCPAELVLEASDDATLADPCLRRELALWALGRLDDSDALAIERELISLASLPPPEEELVREAFDLVPVGADQLLMQMIEAARVAGQGEVADESLSWLPPPLLLKVATQLHSDGAVRALDPTEARGAFVAAITDGKLKPATSIAAMDELLSADDRPRKDLRAAMLAALKDPRCEVAAAAARNLVNGGEPRFAPRPALASVPAALRALCVMAFYVQEDIGADAALRRYVSRRGLQVYDHAEITAEPGEPGGELILPAELVTLPFLEELAEALGHCTGTTCRAGGLRFELGFEPDRTLRRIDRFAEPTTCAAAP